VNLAPRGGRGPFTLEKWYVDTLMPDGSVLIVYLGCMRAFGVRLARFAAELFPPEGPPVRGGCAVHAVEGGEDRLVFGPARLEGDRLSWRTPGLSGEVCYSPRHPSAVLREPFVEEGGRRLLWSVEVPDAEVEGRLSWPGGHCQVFGRGYRDRVWFDLVPWRFPIRELRWGRAVAGSHAAAWVAARTGEGEIAARWEDGRVFPGDATPPPMGEPRVLVETAVADAEVLRFGILRPLLRRLSGDPHEVKWAAPATLGGEPGRAIHERVRWRS
jgi:hypothetical protein